MFCPATMTHQAAARGTCLGRALLRLSVVLLVCGALPACNQSPFMPQGAGLAQPNPGLALQGSDLDRRATALDANNRDLHTQLSQSRQQVAILREEAAKIKQQLESTAKALQETRAAKTDLEKRYQTLEASTSRRGGAVITANNSLQQTLRKVEIPVAGVDVRQEGDLIRIELAADQLFAAGGVQLVGTSFPILDRVAAEVARNYPRQLIGIEGHTDSAPVYGGASNHQLAAAQALAVFEQLTRRNKLPTRQFFLSAHGPNKPLTSNATQEGRAKNRRIELTVYPETVEAQ